MRRLFIVLPLLAACADPSPAPVADPILTLDHVFVLVPPGGADARDALQDAGIQLGGEIIHHEGQGTSSAPASFANAYLELLWVDSTVSLLPEHEESHGRFLRGTGWDAAGPSPFGIGLRRTPSAGDELPFHSRAHTAPWMTPGTQIDVLAPPEIGHGSPRVFVVPRDMGFDTFREDVRREAPESFAHPFAERQLTAVRIVTPTGSEVAFLSDIEGLPGLSFQEGSEHLAELVFDDQRSGQQVDLRPRLPLILRY